MQASNQGHPFNPSLNPDQGQEQRRSKTLVLRLSSLGDVILASSALSALSDTKRVDWVVASEYAELLRGHSRISHLWEFDRKSGARGWIRLCRCLWAAGYSEIIDLHGSLRTRVLRVLFWAWAFRGWLRNIRWPLASEQLASKEVGFHGVWRRIEKQRLRLWAYFIFKRALPAWLRPSPWTERYARTMGGKGGEKPNLGHLLRQAESGEPSCVHSPKIFEKLNQPYLCVMPSSRWPGKCWPVQRYVEVIRELGRKPGVLSVILGSSADKASKELVTVLEQEGIQHVSGIGKWSLREVAQVLTGSMGYLGSDTGLSHLAESLGRRAVVVFGPTVPGLGFGPWQPLSRSVTAGVWCQPCSKDGRRCFRITSRYECMKKVSAERVLAAIQSPASPAFVKEQGQALGES